jgi:ATP-dependent DNA helicase RecQ
MIKYGKYFIPIIKQYSSNEDDNNQYCDEQSQEEYYDNNFDLSELRADKPYKKKVKIRKHTLVGNRYNDGADIDELSKIFNIKRDTILEHLRKYMLDGYSINPEQFLTLSSLDTQTQKIIIQHFRELNTTELSPVYKKLNGRINYDELKIMQLYLMSKE